MGGRLAAATRLHFGRSEWYHNTKVQKTRSSEEGANEKPPSRVQAYQFAVTVSVLVMEIPRRPHSATKASLT